MPRLLHTIRPETIGGWLAEITLPPLLRTYAVLPHMRAAGQGSVILVASDAAKVATPGESVIGAAMAAISMFARTAAIDPDPFSAKLFAKARSDPNKKVRRWSPGSEGAGAKPGRSSDKRMSREGHTPKYGTPAHTVGPDGWGG